MKEKTLTDFALQKLNFRTENIVGWIYVVDSHFNGIKWRKRNENGEKRMERGRTRRKSRKWRDVFKLFGFIIDLKKIGFQRKK